MNVSILWVAAALTLSPAAFATSHETATRPGIAAPAAIQGEVRKVDKDARKITIKHGEIRNLEMPPMTMVFVAQDPAMLEKVKVGDSVKFTAERVNGVITVTSIEAMK